MVLNKFKEQKQFQKTNIKTQFSSKNIMFRNHLLNKMQMFKTIFKSQSLSFDNIKMLLINFRKSKLKNTTTKCIFGEEKHQAMKGFVANFFFYYLNSQTILATKYFIARNFGNTVYVMKPISLPKNKFCHHKSQAMKYRTFGDEKILHQKYILLQWQNF